jgi:murein DD-endopeptidase MepM/ murein hydrolase activator NlpD
MFSYPTKAPEIRRNSLSHTFGADVRKDQNGNPKAHWGWDFVAPIGTPVFAVGAGVVVEVRTSTSFGLLVTIKQDDLVTIKGKAIPIWTMYAHLDSASVAVGDRVTPGQQVGAAGESGNAKGMAVADQHLHFEVRIKHPVGIGEGRVSPLCLFKCPLHGV